MACMSWLAGGGDRAGRGALHDRAAVLRPRDGHPAAGREARPRARRGGRAHQAHPAGHGRRADGHRRIGEWDHRLRGPRRAAHRAAAGRPGPPQSLAGIAVGRRLPDGRGRPALAHGDRPQRDPGRRGDDVRRRAAVRLPAAAREKGLMALVTLRDVDFAYDERPVLRRISFDLQDGDFVCIVGHHGSGKSTLIDLHVGLQHPVAGEVLINGVPTSRFRRRQMAREVALVPQHFALDFDLSVREVVEMGSYCRGKDAESCGDAELTLARLGIPELAGRRFTELSGGEKQLVVSDGEVAAYVPPDEVLRPEIVEAVYGGRAYLHRHAGRTYLTFSPRLRPERRGRVHLVCGGGTGAGLMRELVDAGYDVSAGVLNALDTDEETGSELGLSMAVEAPFSPVGDEAHAQNLELMRSADLVMLAAVPVSHGNARNIKAVLEVAAAGTPVWAVRGVLDDDFTGVTSELEPAGVEFFANDADMLTALRERSPGTRDARATGAGPSGPPVAKT